MDVETREALREIHDDIKRLLPLVDKVEAHHMVLYGNGHSGLILDTAQLKRTNSMYNRLFGGIGAALSFFLGNLIWKWFGEGKI